MIKVLATDLDGTFIPLHDLPAHRQALQSIQTLIAQQAIDLIYVSGRRWELIDDAIRRDGIPVPDVAICDVGTEIRVPTGKTSTAPATGQLEFIPFSQYSAHLLSLLSPWSHEQLLTQVARLHEAIWPQPDECQSAFKTSFFFELAEQDSVVSAIESWIEQQQVPVSPVISKQIDGAQGLIDLLPRAVNKAYALQWWLERSNTPLSSVVFCGDSGNDSAAITSAMNGVAVGNADRHLRESIAKHPSDNVYLAESESTSGVLEGLLHYHSRLCCS